MATALVLTGDADRDYVTVMALHHGGAIEWALTDFRSDQNEQIKRQARENIVTGQQEIAAMSVTAAQSRRR